LATRHVRRGNVGGRWPPSVRWRTEEGHIVSFVAVVLEPFKRVWHLDAWKPNEALASATQSFRMFELWRGHELFRVENAIAPQTYKRRGDIRRRLLYTKDRLLALHWFGD
jgi:hypothetical protein